MAINLKALPTFAHGTVLGTANGSLVWMRTKVTWEFLVTDRLTPIGEYPNLYQREITTDFTVEKAYATLENPSASDFDLDIKKNGVSILSGGLTINGDATQAEGALSASTVALASGDILTIPVTDSGDGLATGLRVYLEGYYTVPVSADVTAPTAPTSLNAVTVSSTEIDLTWGASSDNVAVTGYRITRATDSGFTIGVTVINVGNVTSYNNTGLSPSTTYYFKVQATDGTNLSLASNTDSDTTAAPPLPLDAISVSVYGAYSTKLLSNSYSGPCLRVKDNLGVEEDIGFDGAGLLDTAALSGDSPYVVKTIYDQSGNANDIDEIASGEGAYLDVATKTLRFEFVGSSHFLGYSFGDLSGLTAGDLYVKRKIDTEPPNDGSGGDGLAWAFGTDVNPPAYPSHAGTGFYSDFGSTARKDAITYTGDLTEFHVTSEYSASGDWGMYLNGTQIRQTGTNTVGFSTAAKFGRNASGGLVGNVETVILCDAKANTTDRNYLHANL